VDQRTEVTICDHLTTLTGRTLTRAHQRLLDALSARAAVESQAEQPRAKAAAVG